MPDIPDSVMDFGTDTQKEFDIQAKGLPTPTNLRKILGALLLTTPAVIAGVEAESDRRSRK
jgi:hypothetical protein